MDWYELTEKYHTQTFPYDCRLSSLPQEWQRELAAIWRLEADVNNGAYLQFLVNWGRESYQYANQALNKIGASEMSKLVVNCQALVDEHFNCEGVSPEQMRRLLPNKTKLIGSDGQIKTSAGCILPQSVVDRIYALSYEFMDYPEDIASLGMAYYRSFISTS